MGAESPDPLGISTAIRASGVPAAIELADDLIRSLVGPAAEEVGLLLKDKVRAYRAVNQLETLSRVNAQLSAAGVQPGTIPLRTIAPLLDGCSWEDNPDLREMWAALIANAATDTNGQPPVFAHIMAQLAPLDARMLNRMFVIEGWARGAGSTGRRRAGWRDESTQWETEVAIANLENQGLVAREVPKEWVEEVTDQRVHKALVQARIEPNVSERFGPKRDRSRYEVSLTALGEAFLLASLPPKKRPISILDGVTQETHKLLLEGLHAARMAAARRGDKELETELVAEANRIREAFGIGQG